MNLDHLDLSGVDIKKILSEMERSSFDSDKSGEFLDRNLTRQDPMTLAGLPQVGVLDPDSATKYLQNSADALYDNLDIRSVDNTLNPFLDSVYNLWAATRGLPPTNPLYEVAATLNTVDDFVGTYLPQVSRKFLVNFYHRVDRFVTTVQHPSRVIEVYPADLVNRPQQRSYSYQGRWVNIPPRSRIGASGIYAEEEVIREAAELKRIPRANFYHQTGSAALPGIAKHAALLSANQISKRGTTVKTGEYVSSIDAYDNEPEDSNVVLGSSGIARGYSLARWFDEFHVSFGINRQRLTDFLMKKGVKIPRFEDWANEGIVLGNEVPLAAIDTLHSDSVYLPRIKEWSSRFCPGVTICSFEALELLSYYPRFVEDWRNGKPFQTHIL